MRYFLVSALSTFLLTLGTYSLSAPLMAEITDIRQQLNSIENSRINFPKGKNSTTIQNAVNEIYIFRANAGQLLTLKVNSLGARASVTLYSVNGQPLSPVFSGFTGEEKVFSTRLLKTGDYYILGYAGPTNHSYDFTLSIK